MNTKKKTNPKETLGYALYEALAAKFAGSSCTNSLKETQLLLNFREEKAEKQRNAESLARGFLDKKCVPALPKEVLRETVRIRILENAQGDISLYVRGESFELLVESRVLGSKRASFRSALRRKGQESITAIATVQTGRKNPGQKSGQGNKKSHENAKAA